MKANLLNEILEIGFQKSGKKYVFKDISATVFERYIFFKYSGKDLPIIDSIDRLKMIIKGIYDVENNH